MATIFDVAKYIQQNKNTVTAYELQKLCYYSQAWALALDDKRLFDESFEAWAHGPVCRTLFAKHKGSYLISQDVLQKGDVDNLSPNAKDIIDAVLKKYKGMSGNDLERQTHSELPWRYARKGYKPSARCNVKIDEDLMRDFYRTLRDDYATMDDIVLAERSERREINSDGIIGFAEMAEALGITAADIENAEDLEFELE